MSSKPLIVGASSGSTGGTAGLIQLPRYLFRGGLAGLICGVAFFGLGGRALMRGSALLNPEKRGLLTENGNVVGEITLRGTLELLLFGGVFGGLLAGFVWVLVREWLPATSRRRLVFAGVTAACLGSFAMFTEDNIDFRVLSPASLHLGMFLLLIGAAGVAIAALDPVLERVLPTGVPAAIVYAALALPVGLLTVSVLVQALLSPHSPLWAVALALLAVLAVDLVSWRTRYLGGTEPGWLQTAGVIGVVLACAAAALHFAIEADAILADSV